MVFNLDRYALESIWNEILISQILCRLELTNFCLQPQLSRNVRVSLEPG